MIRKSFALLVTSLILLWILYPGFADRGYQVLGGQFNVLAYLSGFLPNGSLEMALPYVAPLVLVCVLASALILRSRQAVPSSSSAVSKGPQIEEEEIPAQLSAVIKRAVKAPRPITEPATPLKVSQGTEAEEAQSGLRQMAQGSWLNGERCSRCGSANPRNATSCISCGSGLISMSRAKVRKSANVLFVNCRECGKDNLPNALRCSYCGARLIGKVRDE